MSTTLNNAIGAVILLGIIAWIGIVSPNFLSEVMLTQTMRLVTEIGLVAVGMTIIMMAGGIDLSVGSIMALTAVTYGLVQDAGAHPVLAVAVAMSVAALCGAVNGFFVVFLKLPAIVVTIGTLAAFRGLALGLSGSRPLPVDPALYPIAQGEIASIPVQFLIFAAVIAIILFVLNRTGLGRTIRALGISPTAASVAGLQVREAHLLLFVLSGVLSGLAAIIYVARVASARDTVGLGFELDAITIAILGGASVFGGSGSIVGTIIGLFSIGFLRNGMTLNFVPVELQNVAVGLILILVVILQKLVARFFASTRY